MRYLVIGATGYVNLFLADLFQLRQRRVLSLIFSIIGYISICSVIFLLLISFKVNVVIYPLLYIKIAGAGVFFLLLIYSIFIEIKIKTPDTENSKRIALTTGTYGLTRHPGFLWFCIFQLFLISIYRDMNFTLIALGMVTLDFILILIEDYILFPKIFINYLEYKKRVPLLIPGLKNLIKGIRGFREQSE